MDLQRKPSASFAPLAAACFTAITLCGATSRAGDDKSTPTLDTTAAATLSAWSWEAEADASGIARSSFVDGGKVGKVETLDLQFQGIGSYKIREGTLLRFGLELDRHQFGIPEGAAIPDKLQAFHLTVGGDFQLGQAWLVRYDIQPGFFGETTLRGRNFSFPMILGVSYFVSADLQLVAGVSYNPDRKYPVLPGIGFRWQMSSNWVVDAILPTPRIEYSLSKSLTLYVGADLRGDTFRMDDNYGTLHGNPKLNNAVVDYTEIRVGAGATWKINNNLTLEVETGCVLVDEFDFDRAEERFRSVQTPPYGGISLKAAF